MAGVTSSSLSPSPTVLKVYHSRKHSKKNDSTRCNSHSVIRDDGVKPEYEIRRFSLLEPTFESLEEVIRKYFKISSKYDLNIRYKDVENELVTISTTHELLLSLQYRKHNQMKLYIESIRHHKKKTKAKAKAKEDISNDSEENVRCDDDSQPSTSEPTYFSAPDNPITPSISNSTEYHKAEGNPSTLSDKASELVASPSTIVAQSFLVQSNERGASASIRNSKISYQSTPNIFIKPNTIPSLQGDNNEISSPNGGPTVYASMASAAPLAVSQSTSALSLDNVTSAQAFINRFYSKNP